MNRHLLPNEYDLLLDGETGFGVAPLKAHLEGCAECRDELAAMRVFVEEVEHMPHFSPAVGFADKVMAQVQVFEPWHVTALDTARRWVPTSRPMRAVAGVAAISAGIVLSIISIFAATRLDLMVFVAGAVLDKARSLVLEGAGGAISAVFGQTAVAALRTGGTMGIAITLGAFVLAAAASGFGIRALAVASRRHRS